MRTSFVRSRIIAVAATVLSIATAAAGMPATASTITWGTAQNISSDGDVTTTGTLLYAYQFGNSLTGTTTVNGVAFQPFNVANESSTATTGNVTLSATASSSVMYSYDVLTSGSAPFANLPGNYQNLLSSGVVSTIYDNPYGAPLDIQLGGLTAGSSYLVQWWSCATDYIGMYQTVASGSPNVTLDSNTTDTAGGLGQYAIGTFTATGSSQTMTLQGLTMNSSPYDAPTINALQVRLSGSPGPVPEIDPAGIGSVVALATGALFLRERRRWWRQRTG